MVKLSLDFFNNKKKKTTQMKQKKRKLSFDSDDEEDENRIPIEVVNKLVYDYLHQVRVVNFHCI